MKAGSQAELYFSVLEPLDPNSGGCLALLPALPCTETLSLKEATLSQ